QRVPLVQKRFKPRLKKTHLRLLVFRSFWPHRFSRNLGFILTFLAIFISLLILQIKSFSHQLPFFRDDKLLQLLLTASPIPPRGSRESGFRTYNSFKATSRISMRCAGHAPAWNGRSCRPTRPTARRATDRLCACSTRERSAAHCEAIPAPRRHERVGTVPA